MSDRVEDLVSRYRDRVQDDGWPRSVGLFPIPEYPEFERRGMWSTALDVVFITLRYLAPATLLTLFWGQQSFLFKLLKHIDSAFRAVIFSSEEQKRAALQWIADSGAIHVEHLDTVWRHGWILCGILDASLPGACAGHPPTRLSLIHAQTIADHYLGVEPVFSRQELDSNDSLSKHQEWKLATYLDRIRQALSKLTPPVSKPVSQWTSPETSQITLDYVARGSGLTIAQVKNQMRFKIYPTSQQCLDPGEITILIKGPKDTYGMSTIPPILGKAQLLRQKLLGLEAKPSFTENALPITQGVSYLRAFGKNNMNKTFHIPKVNYDIEIEYETFPDHVKVSYVVNLDGRYEISITSRAQNIVGSPFHVSTSHNIIKMLERDSFCLEDGEEIDIVDIKTDKKVVLRIVDFVTEKMLLNENGTLEKIDDDDAKLLMNTDAKIEDIFDHSEYTSFQEQAVNGKKYKFKELANKVILLSKICKVFQTVAMAELETRAGYVRPKTPQDIPDVVNSTFSDTNKNPFLMEPRNKYIIPERLSVSIRSELKENSKITNKTESMNIVNELFDSQKLNLEMPSRYSPSNPFEADISEPAVNEMEYGTYVTSEYETNKPQIEEKPATPIKIIVDANDSPTDSNPFMEDYHNHIVERPKTPILKIINGDVKDREDSVYVDPIIEKTLNDDKLGNEFINPFFIHHHSPDDAKPPVTDFIIGAPVSLPPILRSATPEPALDSLMINGENDLRASTPEPHTLDDISTSVFSTPIHTNMIKCSDSNISSTFHSLDSNIDANNDNHIEVFEVIPNQNVLSKKDTWDSAYVSIDDTSSSPDSNNNDNTIPSSESIGKTHFTSSSILYGIQKEDLSKMGPAEKEIWQTCNELKVSVKNPEEFSSRWDIRKPTFTPIIEESDRSLSGGLNTQQSETDSVTNEFSEISDHYSGQYPKTDSSSRTHSSEDFIIYEQKRNENGVDSASVIHTDVKRQTKDNLEEAISEIQQVTESASASRALHIGNVKTKNQNSKTQFGDKETNIVLERKKYWDNKIQEVEANTSEMNFQQKRRRLSTKHLRHNDSLTKRRGKQIAKNIVNAQNARQNSTSSVAVSPYISPIQSTPEPQNAEVIEANLVEKWKKYWDDKLETEKDETDIGCFKSKTPKSKTGTATSLENISDESTQTSNSPIKQELPEEVFKAFETSPKRFFGTSRKQILSKIDTFLGKPSTENKPLSETSGASYETGLVSSRIFLFHNISQTEDFSNARRKCQSMQNIFQRKDAEKKSNKDSQKVENLVNKESVADTITSQTSIIRDETNEITGLSFKERRARLMRSKSFNKTFDDSRHISIQETGLMHKPVKKVITEINNNIRPVKLNTLRKTSISRSEMDIFNKNSNAPQEDYLDKYQSYDELPKVSVKNFISLYETVSKTSIESTKPIRKMSVSSFGSHRNLQSYSSLSGAVNQVKEKMDSFDKTEETSREELSPSSNDCSTSEALDPPNKNTDDDKHSYVSLSDIELEIIENSSPDKSTEPSPEREIKPHVEYKNRFKKAKEFFKSLEEIREVKKPKKLNECEQMLYNQSTESLENERTQQRVKKNIKSHSMPSSEIAKVWSQFQNDIKDGNNKLAKISEKFQVDDLYSDVVEGKLSRQGSLRGIPNKKAVLETFKSMENLTDKNLSPYDIAITQLKDFANEKMKGKNAQTYLNEYPYVPKTDPSKYQSRIDAEASGLISLKELLEIKKRRNSVPDLRLNPTFTVKL